MPSHNPTEIYVALPLFRLLVDEGIRMAAFPIATGPFEALSCLIHGFIKKREKPQPGHDANVTCSHLHSHRPREVFQSERLRSRNPVTGKSPG